MARLEPTKLSTVTDEPIEPAKLRVFSIQTIYYRNKKVVRVNHAGSALRAVPLAVGHMQLNKYEATVAEVFDLQGGILHAVVKRSVNSNIEIVFKREIKEGM